MLLLLWWWGWGGEGSELCSTEEAQLSESEFVNTEKTIGRGGRWGEGGELCSIEERKLSVQRLWVFIMCSLPESVDVLNYALKVCSAKDRW